MPEQAQSAPPQPDTGHPRRWTILAVLVLSLLVVVLDNTVLNVALRTIADPVHGIGATQAQLEWAINSYTLVFAGLLFTAGVLGDRIGRRRMLVTGLVLFGLASLASAYAQTPTQLIWARALMGIGGAAVMPSTLSIISNVFDPRERGKAIGVWAGAVGLGVAIGPVVGGALLEEFWWGSVFLINVPIILLGVVLVLTLVPESRNPNPGRIDLMGVLLSIAGLVALVYGIIDGGEHGFDRISVWLAIFAGLAILGGFIWHERRSDHPSLDVSLFKDPRFSAAVGSIGLVFFAAFGTFFFLAFYLQLVRGYTPLQAGLLMTPFAAAQLIFAPQSAGMVRRFGPKAVCAVGLSLVTIGLGSFIFVGADTPIWVLIVLTFVQGAGMANVVPPATESIMSSLPREKAGVGSAVSNTVRQVGGALGVAILGSVLAAVYRGEIGDALVGLPEPARAAASESISGAYGVAAQAGPAGPALVDAANEAFVNAMHWAAAGSALVAFVSIFVALAWIPKRANPNYEAPAAPGSGAARKRRARKPAAVRTHSTSPLPAIQPLADRGSSPDKRASWPIENSGRTMSGMSAIVGTVSVDPDRKGPGRPRSARVDEAIIEAVLDLLVSGVTAEALTIEAVAAKAGVGKATIYRRWVNKDALLIDAVAMLKGPLPEIEGVSVRDDLVTLLRPVGREAMTRASAVLPCLISELKRSPTLHACYQKVIEPRRELMRQVLRRGIAAGELRADLDLEVVMAMLVSPMVVQSVGNLNPALDRETLPQRLVDAVWPAIVA